MSIRARSVRRDIPQMISFPDRTWLSILGCCWPRRTSIVAKTKADRPKGTTKLIPDTGGVFVFVWSFVPLHTVYSDRCRRCLISIRCGRWWVVRTCISHVRLCPTAIRMNPSPSPFQPICCLLNMRRSGHVHNIYLFKLSFV
jgi:hypothetical protein